MYKKQGKGNDKMENGLNLIKDSLAKWYTFKGQEQHKNKKLLGRSLYDDDIQALNELVDFNMSGYIMINEEDYFSKEYLSSLSAMSKLSLMEQKDTEGVIGKITPPDLNPFLRAAEALNLVKTIMIVPAFDDNGKSCYMLVRIPYRSFPTKINLTNK